MNRKAIERIRDTANTCGNDSYYALILIRDLCNAILDNKTDEAKKSELEEAGRLLREAVKDLGMKFPPNKLTGGSHE